MGEKGSSEGNVVGRRRREIRERSGKGADRVGEVSGGVENGDVRLNAEEWNEVIGRSRDRETEEWMEVIGSGRYKY